MKKQYYDRSCFERIQPQGAAYEIKLTTKQTEVKEITFIFTGDILCLVARTERLDHVKRRNVYRLTYLDDEVIIDINPLYITDDVGTYSGFTSAHIAYLFIKDFFESVSARISTKNNTSTNEPGIIKTPDEVTSKLSADPKDGVKHSPVYIIKFTISNRLENETKCHYYIGVSANNFSIICTLASIDGIRRIDMQRFYAQTSKFEFGIEILDPSVTSFVNVNEINFIMLDKVNELIKSLMAAPDDISANHILKTLEIPTPDEVTNEKPDKPSYIIRIHFTTPDSLSFLFGCVCKVNANFDDIEKCLSNYAEFQRVGNSSNFRCSLPRFNMIISIINSEELTEYKDTKFHELDLKGLNEVIEYCVKGDKYRLKLLAKNKVTIIDDPYTNTK